MNINGYELNESLYKGRPVAFDTETTGLSKSDEILQIAIVGPNGEPIFSTYVKPVKKYAWPQAQKVNGISPQMVSNAPTMREITPVLKEIFDSASAVVGFNVGYDVRMVEQCSNYKFLSFKVIDAMKIFKKEAPELEHHTLADAATYYLSSEQKNAHSLGAHDAFADTVATMQVFEAQRERKLAETKHREKNAIFGVSDGILVQQVNCKGAIGGGLSGAIIEKFPQVKDSYMKRFEKYGESQLGEIDIIKTDGEIKIANLYSQFDYGNSSKTGVVYTNRQALFCGLEKIAKENPTETIYIPVNIGCGLAGDNWDEIKIGIKKLANAYPNICLINTHSCIIETLNTIKTKLPFLEEKTVSFTGHRPAGLNPDKSGRAFTDSYNTKFYSKTVSQLKEIVRELASNGYTRFITGGAQGLDQLAFWAVNDVKKEFPSIKNVVAVPFEGQSKAWRESGLFSNGQYKTMLKCADEVHYLSGPLTSRNAITQAMHKRNQAMVDVANIVVAVCNDTNEQSSGTKLTLDYANIVGVPTAVYTTNKDNGLLVLNPTEKTLEDAMHSLEYQADMELD